MHEHELRNEGCVRQETRGNLRFLPAQPFFLLSAAWVLWQNGRVAVLWDLSYLLDSAWRFSLGQVPYRDCRLRMRR